MPRSSDYTWKQGNCHISVVFKELGSQFKKYTSDKRRDHLHISKNGNGRGAKAVALLVYYLPIIHKALVISTLQINKILIHATLWMNLEDTMLYKIRSDIKNTNIVYVYINIYEVPRTVKFIETENSGCQRLENGEAVLMFKGYRVFGRIM